MEWENWRWQIAQFLELKWWQRYLAGQTPADYLWAKRTYWARLLQQLDFHPQGRVLDAGCGPAGLFIELANYPAVAVTALDPLLEAYEKRLLHFHRQDYPSVTFVVDSLENFIPEESFDTVVCLNAINHVADITKALDRLWVALRPGGSLLISVDAHRNPMLRTIFQWLPGDVLHPHQYTHADYERMWRKQGAILQQATLLRPGKIFDYWAWILVKPAQAG